MPRVTIDRSRSSRCAPRRLAAVLRRMPVAALFSCPQNWQAIPGPGSLPQETQAGTVDVSFSARATGPCCVLSSFMLQLSSIEGDPEGGILYSVGGAACRL